MKSPFGFVVLDKPPGITSHDCIQKLRKIFEIRRIGHGGTLDPSVTGVLPIAIGNATRLLPYLPTSKKYQGIIQLGKTTTTDDLEGEIISNKEWPILQEDSIKKYLDSFKGTIQQRPPIFSSVHINGKRAYEKARKGEKFILPYREVTIYEIKVTSWEQESGQISLYINCSSGTYIRSLARDIGEKIGCGGTLLKLRRIEALGFKENLAIQLPENIDAKEKDKIVILNPLPSLDHLPKFSLTEKEIIFWNNGRQFSIEKERIDTSKVRFSLISKNNYILVLYPKDSIAGIAILNESLEIQPKVVFNLMD